MNLLYELFFHPITYQLITEKMQIRFLCLNGWYMMAVDNEGCHDVKPAICIVLYDAEAIVIEPSLYNHAHIFWSLTFIMPLKHTKKSLIWRHQSEKKHTTIGLGRSNAWHWIVVPVLLFTSRRTRMSSGGQTNQVKVCENITTFTCGYYPPQLTLKNAMAIGSPANIEWCQGISLIGLNVILQAIAYFEINLNELCFLCHNEIKS